MTGINRRRIAVSLRLHKFCPSRCWGWSGERWSRRVLRVRMEIIGGASLVTDWRSEIGEDTGSLWAGDAS